MIEKLLKTADAEAIKVVQGYDKDAFAAFTTKLVEALAKQEQTETAKTNLHTLLLAVQPAQTREMCKAIFVGIKEQDKDAARFWLLGNKKLVEVVLSQLEATCSQIKQ